MKKNFFFIMLSIIAFLTTSCSKDLDDGIGSIDTSRSANTKDYLLAFKTVDDGDVNTRAAMLPNKKWKDNQIITIGFINGTELAQNRVKEVSKEWEKLINLKFKFEIINDSTKVRIGFSLNGDRANWSYIGTDCDDIWGDLTEPTMNIFLSDENDISNINSQDFAGLILRNFGYMLGLANEHLNLNSPITLDVNKAKKVFQQNGFTSTQINNWLTKKYPASRLSDFTDYDEYSIMALYIPSYIATNGIGNERFNNTLSDKDKEFINKMYPRPLASPYEVGAKGNIYMVMPTGGAGYGLLGWNYDTNTRQEWGDIEKTYKTIDIGEYTWTSENLKMKYWDLWGTRYEFMNHTQDQVNKMTGTTGVYTVQQFEDIFGTWITEYDQALTYRNNYKFYTAKDGSEVQGFNLPDQNDLLQLIGQAPVKTGNVLSDLYNFVYASPADVKVLSGNTISDDSPITKLPHIASSENISKLNITPLGFKTNEWNGSAYNYSFGYGFGLRMKDYARIFVASNSEGIVMNAYLYHFTQARYCKRATATELGYELYYSDTNDDVIVLSPTATAPSGYTVLPKGLERGITLRYSNIRPSNTGEKVITESWTTIKTEATRIRKSIRFQ